MFPYCGCDVASAAVSMDKPIGPDDAPRRGGCRCSTTLQLRAHAGSQALGDLCAQARGLARVSDVRQTAAVSGRASASRVSRRRWELDALRSILAFRYDTSVLAEAAQDGIIEINCSVLGERRRRRGVGLRATDELRAR